jgi:hypothetical protein
MTFIEHLRRCLHSLFHILTTTFIDDTLLINTTGFGVFLFGLLHTH